MKELYYEDKQFKRYVDAYCKKHDIDIDVALTHKIVKQYAEQLQASRIDKETV